MQKIIKEIKKEIKENTKEMIETYKDFYAEEMNYNEKEDGSFVEYVGCLDTSDEGAANYTAGYIDGLSQSLRIIKEHNL